MSFRIRDRMHLTVSEHKHVASKPQLPVSRRWCRARDRVMGVSCAAAAKRLRAAPDSPALQTTLKHILRICTIRREVVAVFTV